MGEESGLEDVGTPRVLVQLSRCENFPPALVVRVQHDFPILRLRGLVESRLQGPQVS